MPDTFTNAELGHILNGQAEAMNRLSTALDRMSSRLDALPDTIDRIYVRKDVAAEHGARIEVTLKEIRADVESMRNLGRWLASGVLVPIVLALIALFSAHGGVH